jgi:uncharacterized protein (TIGR03435 family)
MSPKRFRSVEPAVLLLLGCCAAQTQPAARLEFEVASIKSVSPDPRRFTLTWRGGPGTNDPILFRAENNSLADFVRMAYGVNYYHFSAPDWMSNARFDITARVPQGATKEQFQTMLRNLFIDRFKLVVHHESREASSYDLVVAKNGPKFKEAPERTREDAAAPPPSFPPPLDKNGYPLMGPGNAGMRFGPKGGRLYYPDATMEFLADQISGQVGRPVSDATGIHGRYEISLYWTPDSMRATSPSPSDDYGPTMIEALQDQLGLRLEPRKGLVDFLIVDHAERVPAEN